jgi:hypothetical protein
MGDEFKREDKVSSSPQRLDLPANKKPSDIHPTSRPIVNPDAIVNSFVNIKTKYILYIHFKSSPIQSTLFLSLFFGTLGIRQTKL